MTPEQAWELIRKMTDTTTGWTPPQIRQMDQAFQSWAALIVRDKAVAKPDGRKAGES